MTRPCRYGCFGGHSSSEEALSGQASVGFPRVAAAGATAVRLTVMWSDVAPRVRPAGFDAANPAARGYRWSAFDAQIRAAAAHHLRPIVTFLSAPRWAQGSPAETPPNSFQPSPAQLGLFAKAAARRYGGSFRGLPRVRYWEAWNEPNLSIYLRPQLVNGKPFAPTLYRQMLNAVAASVHAVHRDNLVVAGGLAPFRDITPEVVKVVKDWGPLTFLRDLLCLGPNLQATCSDRATFDVLSIHPYTSGGPTHHALLPDDVSLGDLPKLRRTLAAGVRAGHVSSRGQPPIWVTEFSWDSRPPDPKGVPSALLSRWVAESLYRMWANGVTLVTWFTLRDQSLKTSFFQSGLYFRGSSIRADRPKPSLQAFRFPFVAFKAGRNKVLFWGRTPAGRRARVIVEQSSPGGWKLLAAVSTDRYGIFKRVVRARPKGALRAHIAGSPVAARPFSLRRVPDHFYNPFGLPHLLESKP
jgi:hypothetical protein